MVDLIIAHAIPAAYAVLPAAMRSDAASALLLAIGLQESRFLLRRQQGGGPARGFWQFEAGAPGAAADIGSGLAAAGLAGVLRHRRAGPVLGEALRELRYEPPGQAPSPEALAALHRAIEHNDVLAACAARCLLWTLPGALPGPDGRDAGWDQYLAAWRPGKPRPETWPAFYVEAWGRVLHGAALEEGEGGR